MKSKGKRIASRRKGGSPKAGNVFTTKIRRPNPRRTTFSPDYSFGTVMVQEFKEISVYTIMCYNRKIPVNKIDQYCVLYGNKMRVIVCFTKDRELIEHHFNEADFEHKGVNYRLKLVDIYKWFFKELISDTSEQNLQKEFNILLKGKRKQFERRTSFEGVCGELKRAMFRIGGYVKEKEFLLDQYTEFKNVGREKQVNLELKTKSESEDEKEMEGEYEKPPFGCIRNYKYKDIFIYRVHLRKMYIPRRNLKNSAVICSFKNGICRYIACLEHERRFVEQEFIHAGFEHQSWFLGDLVEVYNHFKTRYFPDFNPRTEEDVYKRLHQILKNKYDNYNRKTTPEAVIEELKKALDRVNGVAARRKFLLSKYNEYLSFGREKKSNSF